MKIKELIAELSKFDEELEVFVESDGLYQIEKDFTVIKKIRYSTNNLGFPRKSMSKTAKDGVLIDIVIF